MTFDHEKLDVYQVAIEFVAKANDIVEQLPRGRGYLADQLQRAALSIVLNIAEGAGKFSPADKAVFYTRARGSATESAAVLDVCRKLARISHRPSAAAAGSSLSASLHDGFAPHHSVNYAFVAKPPCASHSGRSPLPRDEGLCSSRKGRLLRPSPHRTGLADFPHPARQRKDSHTHYLVA